MRYSLALLPLAAASPFKVGTIHNGAAPVLSSTNAGEVVFKKHVKHEDAQSHHEWVQSIHIKAQDERTELRKRSQFPMTTDVFEGLKHTYNIVGGIMGYSGHFDEETLEEIRRHPDVSTLFPCLPAPRVANREHLPPMRRTRPTQRCGRVNWPFRAASLRACHHAAQDHALRRSRT
jgi:hypothetical protein